VIPLLLTEPTPLGPPDAGFARAAAMRGACLRASRAYVRYGARYVSRGDARIIEEARLLS
jgi:hypothetical protein